MVVVCTLFQPKLGLPIANKFSALFQKVSIFSNFLTSEGQNIRILQGRKAYYSRIIICDIHTFLPKVYDKRKHCHKVRAPTPKFFKSMGAETPITPI